MNNQFSQKVSEALAYSKEEAERLRTNYIGPGQLLLGLLREGTGKVLPKWLVMDAPNLKLTVAALPQREDIDLTIQEHLIVELYSR